jgi:hypothetical protein
VVKLLLVELISDGKIEPKLHLAKVKAAPRSGVPFAGVFSSSRPSSLCGGSTSTSVWRRAPALPQLA